MPRSKEFDEHEVLDRAMRLFWRKGYYDTSMQDLVEQMGINRYSIYATFGSKHNLFLAALDRYRETRIAELLRDLEHPEASLEDLRRFFAQRLDIAQTPAGKRGCLVCNTTTELVPHDPAAAASVHQSLDRITQAFRQVLAHAQARGELGTHIEVNRYAHYLTGVFLGFLVYAKSGVDRQALEDYVQVTLAALA
jgi:TetR/AcrR family transcriptional repressor of nem operon